MKEYNQVFLYAKNWYQKSENIFVDLGVIFKQIYILSYWDDQELKRDVTRHMLTIIEEMNLLNYRGHSLTKFISDIQPSETWQYGYTHNKSPFINKPELYPEYDYNEAVVRKCMSIIKYVEKDICGDLGVVDNNLQRKITTLCNIRELKKSKRI